MLSSPGVFARAWTCSIPNRPRQWPPSTIPSSKPRTFTGRITSALRRRRRKTPLRTKRYESLRPLSRRVWCLNCVNLARRTPAKWQLVVRHQDRVGVLAFVMDQIRRAGLNIEEVQNVIFEGALAASCRIQLAGEPPASLLANIENNNPEVIGLDLLRIG
jgi:hypothetical protein